MNPTYEEQIKKLNSLIKDLKFAMLTTFSPEGGIRSRPMTTHNELSFDTGLYFLTRDDAPKVKELNHDARVCLTYSNTDDHVFISISGTASVSNDREKIKELWNPLYRAWFPEGVNDPHLRVITVIPEYAEYWESPNSLVSQSVALIKRVTTGRADVGENEKINFKDSSPI